MTTPGEGLPDEHKVTDLETPRHVVPDPMEGMLDGKTPYRGLPAALALGVIGLAVGAGLIVNELTKGHHSAVKKSAKSAGPFPGKTFVANFDLNELRTVIDEEGRVQGAFVQPNLRADQVDLTLTCEQTGGKTYDKTEETVVIYKSNQPKTGFTQLKPTLAQQTSITDIARYSQEFPRSFSTGGHIGNENAQELNISTHPTPCDDDSFWNYKSLEVTPLIPARINSEDTLEKLVFSLGGAAAVVFVGIEAVRQLRKRERNNKNTGKPEPEPVEDQDIETIEYVAQDTLNTTASVDNDSWGVS